MPLLLANLLFVGGELEYITLEGAYANYQAMSESDSRNEPGEAG